MKAKNKEIFDSTELLPPLHISSCEQYFLLPGAARILLHCAARNCLAVSIPSKPIELWDTLCLS